MTYSTPPHRRRHGSRVATPEPNIFNDHRMRHGSGASAISENDPFDESYTPKSRPLSGANFSLNPNTSDVLAQTALALE